jgi:hypothetical protein
MPIIMVLIVLVSDTFTLTADAFVMVSRYGEVTLLGYVNIQPRTDERCVRFRYRGQTTWALLNVPANEHAEDEIPENLLFYNNLYPEGMMLFKAEGQVLLNTTLSVLRMVDFGSTLSVHDRAYLGNMVSVGGDTKIVPLDPDAPVNFPNLDVDETFGRVYLGSTLSVKDGAYFYGGSGVSVFGSHQSVLPCAACMGSSLSIGNFARYGSSLSVRSFFRIGTYLSVKSYTRLGSGLSLFSCARFGSSHSVYDSVSFSSGLSVKSFLKIAGRLSVYEKLRLRSTLSILDCVSLGSLLSIRSFSRQG